MFINLMAAITNKELLLLLMVVLIVFIVLLTALGIVFITVLRKRKPVVKVVMSPTAEENQSETTPEPQPEFVPVAEAVAEEEPVSEPEPEVVEEVAEEPEVVEEAEEEPTAEIIEEAEEEPAPEAEEEVEEPTAEIIEEEEPEAVEAEEESVPEAVEEAEEESAAEAVEEVVEDTAEEQTEEKQEPVSIDVLIANILNGASEDVEEQTTEEVAEEEDEETVVIRSVDESTGMAIVVRYRKSFMARLIQSKDETKAYYTFIKNNILSYKKVKNRISWAHENFNSGRNNLVRFTMRGKTLCLYLALNPDDYADTKYKVERAESKKYEEIPCLYRIKNARRAKYALDLIAAVMEKFGIPYGVEQKENYYKPYQTTEQLIAEGLIKELIKEESYSDFLQSHATVKVEEAPAPEVIEQPVEEAVEEQSNEVSEQAVENTEAEQDNEVVEEVVEEPAKEEVVENTEAEQGDEVAEVAAETEEEPAEEIAEETVEEEEAEQSDEVAEEAVEETAEEVVEETSEEVVEETEAEQSDEIAEIESLDAFLSDIIDNESKEAEEAADVAEEAAEEEEEEAVVIRSVDESTGIAIVVRYRKSFTAKLIQAKDQTKAYYTYLKNVLLSYKKVKNRISWAHENFNSGRNNLARFTMRGKTLCLYLALNPDDYADTKYKVERAESKKYEDIPCLYRIKNARRVKYAVDLIATVMAKYGIVYGTEQTENYYKPYETTEQLIAEGLIKELVKEENYDEFIQHHTIAAVVREVKEETTTTEIVEEPAVEVADEPAVEEEVVEEPVVEVVEEPVEEAVAEEIDEVVEEVIEEPATEVAEEVVEEPAIEVVEEVVEEPVTETVEEVTEEVAAETVEEEPETEEEATEEPEEVEEVIEEPIEEPVEEEPVTEEIAEEVVEETAEEEINEVVEEEPVDEPAEEVVEEIVEEPVTEAEEEVVEETAEEQSNEVVEEEVIEETVVEEPIAEQNNEVAEPEVVEVVEEVDPEKVEIIEQSKKEVAKKRREKVTATEVNNIINDEVAVSLVKKKRTAAVKPEGPKATVNIDTLNANFEAGERVNLAALKAKKLVAKNTAAVKVLARGTLTKPLTVEANAFSIEAVKMIILTGGTVIKG